VGQLGIEKALPGEKQLFSQYELGLSDHDSTPEHAQIVLNCLKSEIPGAHGVLGSGYTTRVDAYETNSALASDSSPEMGMVMWYISGDHHTNLSPCFHSVLCNIFFNLIFLIF